MPFQGSDLHWRKVVQATAGNSSTPIVIPAGISNITATVFPAAGGSATVQHSTGDEATVENDPANAGWTDWDAGAVSARKSMALLSPVTGLRVNAVGGTWTLEVVGERKWS